MAEEESGICPVLAEEEGRILSLPLRHLHGVDSTRAQNIRLSDEMFSNCMPDRTSQSASILSAVATSILFSERKFCTRNLEIYVAYT